MANNSKIQVPADVHALSQLLCKLELVPGPMKAAKVSDDQINIWFISARGTADIKRVSARLERGAHEVCDGSPRRVYLDLRVQGHSGEWKTFSDDEYRTAGLQPPHEYDGESYIGLEFDNARGAARWWDEGPNKWFSANSTIGYFRLLKGDRERAVAEAKSQVAEFERE
jgi:hypothetical protein